MIFSATIARFLEVQSPPNLSRKQSISRGTRLFRKFLHWSIRIISSHLSDSSWKPWSSSTRGERKSSLAMADFLATRDTLKKSQMMGQMRSPADDHSAELR